jgi:hypothetical protein
MNFINCLRVAIFSTGLLSINILFPVPIYGESTSDSQLLLFIDCNDCDIEFIKTELTYVEYARDKFDANIYILVTTISNSVGGSEYTLLFSGSDAFQGLNDEIRFYSEKNDSDDLKRLALLRHIQLGLVRYLLRTPIKDQIQLAVVDQEKETLSKDPWDHWVFTLSCSGGLSGQEATQSQNFTPKIHADRVTEEWRIFLETYYKYDRDEYEIESGSVTTLTTRKDATAYFIKSLTDHWSFGIFNKAYASTFDNTDLGAAIRPVIEYNLFPYRDATRKQLLVDYGIGPEYYDYIEETIYDKTEEFIFREKLDARLVITQPWGTISSSVAGEHHVQDFGLYRLDLATNASLYLFGGFSLTFSATASIIRDQISLPKSGATDEEILLQLQELESEYSYNTSLGLSYSFGSKVSNIVNPRFGF